MDVAGTIVAQMGGFSRLRLMLGAKVMEIADGIGVKWPNKNRSRGNYFEVKLRSDDTYDFEFFSVQGGKKSVKKYERVYADDLIRIFQDQTGWVLRL